MAARSPTVRQSDVTRAVKGAIGGGLEIGSVEVFPDGRIVVKSKADGTADDGHALAKWEAGRNARKTQRN